MNTTASEQRTLDDAVSRFPEATAHVRKVVERVRSIRPLPPGATVLDIGAAQGAFVIAFAQLGFEAAGVEPWADARDVGEQLAVQFGVDIKIVDGIAEKLPIASNSMDFVHAKSVVEHVDDAAATFREVYRVLKPGGVFWFLTASTMCPVQNEIRGFPGFGWYPNSLKMLIMSWARDHRPNLIGHTTRPAYHWFTPWKARRMLKEAGFANVFDRWDLRRPAEGGRAYQLGLAAARCNAFTKTVADVIVPTCSYAAVK